MIIGLDISTRTGCVILNKKGDCVFQHEICAKDKNLPIIKRGMRIAKVIRDLLRNNKIEFAVIEDYAILKFSAEYAITVGTLIRRELIKAKVPYFLVSPPSVKKFATGKGRGDKDMVRLGVYKNWGYEHESDNVTDAYAIAKIGHYKQTGEGTVPQREVVRTVFEPKIKKQRKKRK